MTLVQRNYTGPADHQAMLALAQQSAPENLHITDLPYRFSSWAFDQPDRVALWQDAAGELVAWAVLQTPFWALDLCYLAEQPGLHQTILAWADVQAQRMADTPHGRPMWFVTVFPQQTARLAALEAAGWICLANAAENPWSKVWLARDQTDPLPTPALPAGCTLRPLAGAAEVEAYVTLHHAVFQSTSMTVAWRQRTLQQPAYQPDLDLVIAAPDGTLAAFCIGWLGTQGIDGELCGQIEPLGVDAAYRGQGLGQAILTAAVQRLHERGAHRVYVETDSYRDAAFALYEAVGFRVVQDVLVYRKEYPTQGA